MKPHFFATQQLSKMMETLCLVCQVLGALFLAVLPWILRLYLRYKYGANTTELFYPMLILLYVSGVSAFVILHHGRCILHNIAMLHPFTGDTARRIQCISGWCLPIALIYLVGVFVIPSPLILLVGIAFLFLAVLLLIFSELFYQAVRFKEENDLTI